MNNVLEIQNLNKRYGPFLALRDVNIRIAPGSITGLLGPNGCGKTTTMKIIAGLIMDYQGEVRILGEHPGVYTKSAVSYLPEKTYFNDWMSPKDTIQYFSDFYADFDAAKAEEMVQRFGLSMKQKLKTMSKGMQEKLQVILVMCRVAKLYLLDEPLSGIDPAARSVMLDVILNNYTQDAALLLSTHLIYDVERIFDSIIMMGGGAVILQDSVDNIREQHGKSVEELFKEVFKC